MEPFIAEFAPITETAHDKSIDDIYGIGQGDKPDEATPEYKIVVMGGGGVGDTSEPGGGDYDHPDDIDLLTAGVAESADCSFELLSSVSIHDDLISAEPFDLPSDLFLG